jgi:hypothetical protein
MRVPHVAMSDVLANGLSQVRLTERDDAVETLLLDWANNAFDEGVRMGTAE